MSPTGVDQDPVWTKTWTMHIPAPRSSAGTLLPATLCLLLFSLSCGRGGQEGEARRDDPPAEGLLLDLAADLPAARVVAEPGRLALGDPSSRAYLGEGFSRAELDRQRRRAFVWGIGERSLLAFPLLEVRDLTLSLEARPFRFPGAPGQEVWISLNGRELGRLELAPELASYSLRLPAEALRLGANELELHYAYHREPREVLRSEDRRSLAVAWYGLAIGALAGPPGQGAPRADPGRSLLWLPQATRLEYFLKLPPGSSLAVDRITPRGGSRLDCSLTPAGGAERALAVAPGSERRPLAETGIARLRLTASPSAEPGAGVALLGPRLLVPESPAEERQQGPDGAGAPPATARPGSARPDVLVYMIDTLRADHLGCYGSDRGLTPEIDAFVRGATLFESALAQASWTKASVASVLTGLAPLAHGTNGRDDRLPDPAVTLAEHLAAAGYETAAFVTNPNVTEAFGFAQGFETFRDLGEESGSARVGEEALRWLDRRAGRRPFFLYLHTLDPHTPYDPPAAMRERFAPDVPAVLARGSKQLLDDLQAGRRPADQRSVAALEALYAAEVAANDESFGRLLDGLEERGFDRTTLVVLVSDHGEEFLEHGNWEHGKSLHVESLRVPLIVRPPGGGVGRRVAEDVQHLDLLPTVLEAAGLPVPAELPGRSLLPWLEGADGELGAREIVSFLHLDGPARISVRDGRWAMLQELSGERLVWPRLYDRRADPAETRELSDAHEIVAGYLEARMRRLLGNAAGRLEAEPAELDPELVERLRALGYLD